MRAEPLIGKEVRVAGGHDGIGHDEAGVAVVRMEAITAPGVMAQDDIGADGANRPCDLPLGPGAIAELAVGPAEEIDLAPAQDDGGGGQAAVGQVTIKDLDLGRALSAGIADNTAWRAERPGQMTVPRAQMVATILQILETRP